MSVEYRFDHRGKVELKPTVHKRSLCWLYFTLFFLLQVGIAGWLYLNGYLTPVDAQNAWPARSLRGAVEEQERRIAKQGRDIVRLEAQVATAQRAEAIQSTANEVLRAQLVLAETELSESRDRLLLYEEVLSPSSTRGLNVQYLDIKQRLIDADGKKLAHDRYYQYHLILTNVRGKQAQVKGRFDLTLQGEQQGEPLRLTLSELVIVGWDGQQPTQTDNAFEFKYYQGLEGNIALPDNFIPQQLIVELMPVSGKKVRRTYDWRTLISAGDGANTTTMSKE